MNRAPRPTRSQRLLRAGMLVATAVTLCGAYVLIAGPLGLAPPQTGDARAGDLPPADPRAPGARVAVDPAPVSGPRSPAAGLGDAPEVTLRWPLKPFDSPHPIRGTFAEPRGLFGIGHDDAKGAAHARRLARLDPVNTPGNRTLHIGVDIMGKDNAPVYAVEDGVAKVGGSGQDRWVQVGNYRYVHIRPTVRSGQPVKAYATPIGSILPGDGHVHLTRYWKGQPVNQLAFGGFVGWQDTAPPVLGRLRIFTGDGTEFSKHRLKGKMAFFIRAEDRQSQGGNESGIYLLSYRLVDRFGRDAIAPHTVFELRHLPRDDASQKLFSTGSTRHEGLTNFFYRLSLREPDGMLDTARLRPGRYRLEVTAMDAAGNATQRTYHLRNRPQGAFLKDFRNARAS